MEFRAETCAPVGYPPGSALRFVDAARHLGLTKVVKATLGRKPLCEGCRDGLQVIVRMSGADFRLILASLYVNWAPEGCTTDNPWSVTSAEGRITRRWWLGDGGDVSPAVEAPACTLARGVSAGAHSELAGPHPIAAELAAAAEAEGLAVCAMTIWSRTPLCTRQATARLSGHAEGRRPGVARQGARRRASPTDRAHRPGHQDLHYRAHRRRAAGWRGGGAVRALPRSSGARRLGGVTGSILLPLGHPFGGTGRARRHLATCLTLPRLLKLPR